MSVMTDQKQRNQDVNTQCKHTHIHYVNPSSIIQRASGMVIHTKEQGNRAQIYSLMENKTWRTAEDNTVFKRIFHLWTLICVCYYSRKNTHRSEMMLSVSLSGYLYPLQLTNDGYYNTTNSTYLILCFSYFFTSKIKFCPKFIFTVNIMLNIY